MTSTLTMTPASIATEPTRFHTGLHVADLTASVRFYRALLGVEPAKHVDDYAKFELESPPLVLALYPSPQKPGGALNHVGLRFPDSSALVEVQRRLEESGTATQRQQGVDCCYARQTKFWVTDPDKTLWEIYTLHEDIEHSGFEDPPAPLATASAETTWQHRLTDKVPARVPHENDSLDEVLLEGTFNAPLTQEQIAALLSEAWRVLKPGGRIAVHGLVSDKAFPGEPKLPGLASLVRRVPVETEPLEAILLAGFRGAHYEKLGDIHCFGIAGVELRELRLQGFKPKALETGPGKTQANAPCLVMYKGPFAAVAAEDGTVFERGLIRAVTAQVAAALRSGPSAEQFSFLGAS
jgi:catechol 2,3-dioxygenase-like lactoylglutathione lyase family enzyme